MLAHLLCWFFYGPLGNTGKTSWYSKGWSSVSFQPSSESPEHQYFHHHLRLQPLSPSVPCLTHLVFSLLHSHTWISSCFFVQHLCQHSCALSVFFFPLSSADIEDRYYIHVESSPPQRFPNFLVLHWIATSQPQYLDIQSYAFWFPHTLPNHNCSYRIHILRNQCP